MPRVAAADPPHREPGAAAGAVERQRLERVLRAGGVEPAAGRQVHADEPPGRGSAASAPGRGAWLDGAVACRVARGHGGVLGPAPSSVATCSRSVGKATRHAPLAPPRRDRRRRERSSSACSCHRGAEPAAHAVALHRGAEPAPDGVGHPRRVVGSVGEEAQRDRAGSPPAGPARGPRTSHGRGRARSGRETLPAAGAAGAQHGAPPLVRIRRRKPWVLARLRLFGWNVRFNEEPPRGGRARPGVGDRAGGGNDPVYGSDRRVATRGADRGSGENPRDPLSHKDAGATLPRLARRRPAAADFPGESQARPGRARATRSATISTPVDAPVDNSGRRTRRIGTPGGRTDAVGEER